MAREMIDDEGLVHCSVAGDDVSFVTSHMEYDDGAIASKQPKLFCAHYTHGTWPWQPRHMCSCTGRSCGIAENLFRPY
jgi:hypothetical protein